MTYYRKPRPPCCFFVDIFNSLSLQSSRFRFPIPGFLLAVNLCDVYLFSQKDPSDYSVFLVQKLSFDMVEDLTDK